ARCRCRPLLPARGGGGPARAAGDERIGRRTAAMPARLRAELRADGCRRRAGRRVHLPDLPLVVSDRGQRRGCLCRDPVVAVARYGGDSGEADQIRRPGLAVAPLIAGYPSVGLGGVLLTLVGEGSAFPRLTLRL